MYYAYLIPHHVAFQADLLCVQNTQGPQPTKTDIYTCTVVLVIGFLPKCDSQAHNVD